MAATKLSVSCTPELADALRSLADARGEDLSRTLEILLRENRLVQREIELQRGRAARPRTKKGRDVEKLLALAKVGRSKWERAIAEGRVRPLDDA